jgi:hypothetical protein
MKYPIYILSYKGAKFLEEWLFVENYPNCEIYIIDNGPQTWTRLKDRVVYSVDKNIGCAGGWNLMCDIGFKYHNNDKIIIGSDDALFSEEIAVALYDLIDDVSLPGTYDNGFHFAMFGLSNNLYNTVGRFDENFVNCTSEDFDYVYRCLNLNIVNFPNLDISHRYNHNLVSSTVGIQAKKNLEYIIKKWNMSVSSYTQLYKTWDRAGLFTKPFNGIVHEKYIPQLIDLYPEISEHDLFPSEIQFKRFMYDISNNTNI